MTAHPAAEYAARRVAGRCQHLIGNLWCESMSTDPKHVHMARSSHVPDRHDNDKADNE